jgi:hypothetical protein
MNEAERNRDADKIGQRVQSCWEVGQGGVRKGWSKRSIQRGVEYMVNSIN